MSAAVASLGHLNRLREIAAVVVRHGFGPLLERARIFQALGLKPRGAAPAIARPLGERLRMLLGELGPTFVKLGQVLSTRADLLPQEVVRELSLLQDRVPPFALEEVRAQVESSLGRTIEDAFAFFDPEPLASASIAQVHRARTRAGIDVIVKVQRPNIRSTIESDIELLYWLARLLESVFEEQLVSPTEIVREFETALLGELDFTREAANVEAFRRANAGRSCVVVPHVLEHLSSKTVLTLEHLSGPKITDFDPERHDRNAIARNLLESAFVQLFEDGLFHGDPHPGNLLVLDGNRIGMIDLGLVGRVSRPMQETLIVMCLAVALRDSDTLARLLYKVGVSGERVSLSALSADIQIVLDRYLGHDLASIDAKSLLGDLLDLAHRYRIRIPREYAVLAKAAVTIEGVVRRICPDLDVLEVAMPYASRLLVDRFSPASRDSSARRALFQLQGYANDVPAQLSQVLMDLESGRLNVASREVESQLGQLVGAVRLLAFTVFASALTLGAVLWISRSAGDGTAAWVLLGGAVSLFVGAFAWLVLGVRPRRLRLRR